MSRTSPSTTMILPPDQFETFLRLVKAAGNAGMKLPSLVPGHRLSGEQMHLVNTAYDSARGEHRARTLKGRSR
jgi:hypothetical protein